ncbi:retrovirus-related pol polyprotein from transposon TNT 1-94, partial [Tanacetum coccineum]
PHVSTYTGVIHRTSVSRPHLRSPQMKENVMQNNSQVKSKKTEVEDHHRISSISYKTKSVTACNDSLKSITSNVNAVCATCGKCVFNSNHDACVYKFLNDVNARTKKPNVVPINLEVAFQKSTCFVRDLQGNDLLTGNRGTDLYTISLQETTSSTPICLMAKASPTQAWLWHRRLSHLNFDYINLLSKKDVVIGLPKLKLKLFPSQQELDLLFGPLYDEFFNGTSRVNKSSSTTEITAPQDTHTSTNIHPTSESRGVLLASLLVSWRLTRELEP